MPSERNRVYISNREEAPNDAIVRRGGNGSLFYRPDERGTNSSVGGDKQNELLDEGLEKRELFKSFETPNGVEFEDFGACVAEAETRDEIEDPEGYCARAHYEDTGEWPAEKSQNMTRVYIGSEEEAPDGATVKEDDNGDLFFLQEAWDRARSTYPEDVVDEGAHETDAEDAGDGVESEQTFEDLQDELADRIQDTEAD